MLKEELSKEINDNNEATNKKLEEETIGIKQQIIEAGKKWSQTNQEVQDFKEEVNTKITNIEENNRNKWEENRRETQEELGNVWSQFTEKCDGIEVAMTNITGQVRQSQEEIELIRNRPTNITSIPTNESREWLNFRQYKRKPMEFLARIEEYFAKHRGNRWSTNRELLDESFREMTANWWWMAIRSEIMDYQQFKNLFKVKYWSESTQNLIRDNVCHGRYNAHIGTTLTAYFLGKVCLAKHLEPNIPVECLVNKLSYHYNEDIIRARRGSQIKTVQALSLIHI